MIGLPISLAECSFSYKRGHRVLDGLDLTFPQGRSVLLGPNGAGKSTLLGLACSLLSPSRGSVRLGRLDPSSRGDRAAFRRQVGWLPQEVRAIPGMNVREHAAYAAWLKGSSRRDAWDTSLAALAQVGLDKHAGRKASDLSGGQLRRLGIASTLAHQARVILMDEPTAGLDPAQRAAFRDLILGLDGRVHIVVSTHQTEDLAAAYDHVLVLDAGELRFHGTAKEFLALAGTAPDAASTAYGRLVSAER